MMDAEKGALILDAGCGPGVHSIRVAKAGHRVCAIDISEAMLRHAKHRAQLENVAANIDFTREDLTQLSFPDESFPYVFSWGVVIHIPDAESALSELARVVQRGGKLALYITNSSAVDNKFETVARSLLRKPLVIDRRRLGDLISYDTNAGKLFLWRFSTSAVINYLRSKGLQPRSRHIGELSEFQRRLRGVPRKMMLHMNNFAYSMNLPSSLGITQLLVFEKDR